MRSPWTVCLLLIWHFAEASARRVAIVGGGVGGGFAARFLRQRWPEAQGNLHMDL